MCRRRILNCSDKADTIKHYQTHVYCDRNTIVIANCDCLSSGFYLTFIIPCPRSVTLLPIYTAMVISWWWWYQLDPDDMPNIQSLPGASISLWLGWTLICPTWTQCYPGYAMYCVAESVAVTQWKKEEGMNEVNWKWLKRRRAKWLNRSSPVK